MILRELFRHGIRPPFISAESSSILVFALLAGMGEYGAFKLVEGATVSRDYRNHPILVDGLPELYSFPPHSAGPFGDDIIGNWLNADDFFDLLRTKKMGWRDIHATNLVQLDRTSRAERRQFIQRHFLGWLSAKLMPTKRISDQ